MEEFKILEEFTTFFVKRCEEKLEGFEKEAVPGGTGKVGTKKETFTSIGSALPSPLSLAVVTATNIGANLDAKQHRIKAKMIYEFFRHIEKQKLRRILVEACVNIVMNFEPQFNTVTDADGSWARAIEKLAEDAVDRLMSYIYNYMKNNPNQSTNIEVSWEFITKGVILGEQTKKTVLKYFKSGHTVIYKGEEWNTSDLYSKTGLVIDENGDKKYYLKNYVEKYGFRRLFPWESKLWESNGYKECAKPSEEYKYTLTQDDLREKIEDILHNIKKEFPLKELTTGEFVDILENVVGQNSRKTTQAPVWFNVQQPVKDFTGRNGKDGPLIKLHNALQSENGQVVISQVASVYGLGGIGKTESARKYACENKNYYDNNVIWINAENEESIKESFRTLARELKIPLIEERLQVAQAGGIYQEREIGSIISDVYKYFKDSKSLFIFDNAGEYNDIAGFLPYSLPPNYKKPYILITSRNQNWDVGEEGKIEVVKLDDFTPEEATEFIKKALNIEDKSQTNEIQELAETLHYFPLALRQATAYIKEQAELKHKIGKTFKISDYLKDYRKENKKTDLLNFDSKHRNNRYIGTVFTTWMITFENIEKKGGSGKRALDILNIMAYLDSDEILTEKLFSELAGSEEKLLDAIALLEQFSMINTNGEMSNIHRLVQEVVRLQLRREGKEEQVLKKALLINIDNMTENSLRHVMSVLVYIICDC